MRKYSIPLGLFILVCLSSVFAHAQESSTAAVLTVRQQQLISVSALAAKGDLPSLSGALQRSLDAGLSINELKEALVHLYAYAGFPRSIRGLQTLMNVVDKRKAEGKKDLLGRMASPIPEEPSKYNRGKAVLESLTGQAETSPKSGYAAFAPEIELFLKEHLFADIFERDVLSYADRELLTISILSSIGGVEPMLRSHLLICLHIGLQPDQLQEFVYHIGSTLGMQEASAAQAILDEVLNSKI